MGALLVGVGPANASTVTYISVLTPPNSSGKKVIDIRYESMANRGGATIYDLRTTGNFDNQRWVITRVPSNYGYPTYRLENLNSGLCLDESMDKDPKDGTAVYQYDCTGASNQVWEAEPVSATAVRTSC